MAKWVYKFHEGSAAMRNLLGGKGCNLAEMTNLGMESATALWSCSRKQKATCRKTGRCIIL